MNWKRKTSGILNTLALIWLCCLPVQASDAIFPRYDIIEPNVSFWVDIYSRYTTSQAVVHDSVNLDIVYGEIVLVPPDGPDAREVNRQRMRQARQDVEDILKRLSADPLTKDVDCRRVAARFGDGADARTFSRASRCVRCQIGQRDRFQAGLVRSGAYLERMRTILKSYGVPEDLAFLPHVESSFDVRARSKFGATGMWQFTRSTGQRFMIIDDVLDERRDPITATHAAAVLLKENYDKLGSWPLAITAYNHGAAGMQRAKAQHGEYPAVFSAYKGRTFKFASRNFYSEFLAARQVASDYRGYFGPLAFYAPIRFRSAVMTAFVAFDDLCNHFKLYPQVLRALNPALLPTVLDGRKYVPKGCLLNLPALHRTEDMVLAAVPAKALKPAQKPNSHYIVKRGDTAGKIAKMHGVKLADLITANNLDIRATIYARQTLRIPQYGQPIDTRHPVPALWREDTLFIRREAAERNASPDPISEPVPDEETLVRYRRPGPSPAEILMKADI